MNDMLSTELSVTSFDLWQKLNEFRQEEGGTKIRHDDFLSRVEDECDDLGVCENFAHPQNGREMKMYRLNQDQSLLVGMRESKVVRRKVLTWLKELASAKPALPDFSNPVAAARAWADEAEQKQMALARLEEAKPAIEFKEKYVEATGLMGFREVCKLLGVKEPVFRRFLTDQKIMYRLGKEWTAYQNHIDTGRFEVKTGVADAGDTGHAYKQAKFTPKGVTWVSELWSKHESYYMEGDK